MHITSWLTDSCTAVEHTLCGCGLSGRCPNGDADIHTTYAHTHTRTHTHTHARTHTQTHTHTTCTRTAWDYNVNEQNLRGKCQLQFRLATDCNTKVLKSANKKYSILVGWQAFVLSDSNFYQLRVPIGSKTFLIPHKSHPNLLIRLLLTLLVCWSMYVQHLCVSCVETCSFTTCTMM